MEPHRDLGPGTDVDRPDLSEGPHGYFEKSLAFVRRFYSEEMDQISSVRLDDVTPEFFFREYVWTVHTTGFSAKAVGKFMPRLLEAYGPWEALADEFAGDMFERVRLVCNNLQKARAVQRTARLLRESVFDGDGASKAERWAEFKSRLSSPEKLAELPYIGKVTCYHLGRNIGMLECVKPDLHLVRMAEHWGYPDCLEMCKDIRQVHADKTGETLPLGVVDLALWYQASTTGTISIKTNR